MGKKERLMHLCFFQTATQNDPWQMLTVESSFGYFPSDWHTLNEFSTKNRDYGLHPPWLDTCTKVIKHAQKVIAEKVLCTDLDDSF